MSRASVRSGLSVRWSILLGKKPDITYAVGQEVELATAVVARSGVVLNLLGTQGYRTHTAAGHLEGTIPAANTDEVGRRAV